MFDVSLYIHRNSWSSQVDTVNDIRQHHVDVDKIETLVDMLDGFYDAIAYDNIHLYTDGQMDILVV
jgi:hypothetical protein